MRLADERRITPPEPFTRVDAQASVHWIQGEVARELDEVPSALDEDRVESSLKEVSVDDVSVIERLCVCAVQLLHALGQVRLQRLEDEVVMVGHEAVAMAEPPPTLNDCLEQFEKQEVVVRVDEDLLSSIAARCDVIDPVRDQNA
jgi:hypothetical protein